MANRTFIEFNYSLERRMVNLFATVSFGASGAPTLQTWDPIKRSYSTAGSTGTKGIKSIVRVSTGLYTITLQDPYNKFLGAAISFQNASASAAPFQFWPTPNANLNVSATPSIQVQFANSSGTATDPASGEQVVINLTLMDSTSI